MEVIVDANTYSVTVSIPEHGNVQYRYFICAVVSNETIIVRRWETSIAPRTVTISDKNTDFFGEVNGKITIDRGWLTSETIIQLKMFNAPFEWKQNVKKHMISAKITPMTIGGDSFSLSPCFTEVTNIGSDKNFQEQPKFGWLCQENDLVIFHMTVSDPDSTGFLIDLFEYSSVDEIPRHFGYQYIMPTAFKESGGNLEIPISCASNHLPIGKMKLGYLQIRPFKCHPFSMDTTFQRYWNPKWTGLDVGHRGSGASFKTTDTIIRENTIASFNNAVEHGADMIEFDVQLSKDLVPVIYHDFNVYISSKAKSIADDETLLKLPVRDLSLDELKKLKIYHTTEGKSGEERIFPNNELQENQAFPQLAEVLDLVDPHVAFNIEIKWSQELYDGSKEGELEITVDRNLYIDCILETVFRQSKKRRIVFSCFDADICNMLRYKQNRFPVMFLTLGGSSRHKKFRDPRCNSAEATYGNAHIMELLGVVAHTEGLLRDPSQVFLN